MNRYWDLSERQRSELTAEQVESMLAVELMEKGVQRIEPPKLLPVEFPTVKKTTVWVLKRGYSQSDVAYETAEAAAAAMKSGFWLDYNSVGDKTVYSINRQEIRVESADVTDASEVAAVKSQADKAKANKKANDDALREYNDNNTAVTEAVEGVWDDYHECRRNAHNYKRVIATREEYRNLCDGDEALADTFLLKAYNRDTIKLALEWFGEPPLAEPQPIAIAVEPVEAIEF